jgi:zinc protease
MTAVRVALELAERQLDNGLTVLALRNPGVSTFAAALALDVDVRDEGRGEHGLANLVGDCLDEGSKRHSALELAAELDRIGGTLEGNTSGASVQCPAESARRAVDLMMEVATIPAFRQREVRRVQQEILQEIRTDEDDPRAVASQRLFKAIYGRHPYGRPAHGTRRSVAAFTPADLRRFHRHFVPTGGYLAAAGPAAVEKTLDLLERAARAMVGRRAPRPPLPAPELPAETIDEHIPMAREQVHVYAGHIGIRRTHPDFYALSVMDHILGTGPGFTSRISRRLRDEQGLCYSVDAAISRSAREEPGCYVAYIGTSPEHRQRAIDGFVAEMKRMRKVPPSEEELRDVQDYLTGSFVWQLERNANLARYAIRVKRFDLGFDYLQRYPDLIRSVTREEVLRVAREHLHPDRMHVVSAGG